MVFLAITIFLIYALLNGGKNKKYSVSSLFVKYERPQRTKYMPIRNRSKM